MTNFSDYRYTECGLDNVILKGFTLCTDDAGDEVVTIPHVNQLHRVITRAVAMKPSGLLPKEIRFLRTEMGLTQAQLASIVGKDAQTIGRWERGEFPVEQAYEIIIRARALERAGSRDGAQIDELARWTGATAPDTQFLIDASDPDHYRLLPRAA